MSKSVKLKIKKLNDTINMPKYATSGSAGLDIEAAETVNLYPNSDARIISTGLFLEIPEGYEAQIRPRSGLSAKTKLRVANSPGTIDSDYRGELKIIVCNMDANRSFKINKGDRIAQLIVAPVVQAEIVEVETLSETERADGGLGSTGK